MKGLVEAKGTENPYLIGKEMGEEMTAACTVVKDEQRLLQARAKIAELRERFGRIQLSDTGLWTNQNLSHARAVGDMLAVADVIVEGSLARRERRQRARADQLRGGGDAAGEAPRAHVRQGRLEAGGEGAAGSSLIR
jgi:succinate dehydrogenase/fumarate reductase flavoprotein subunit